MSIITTLLEDGVGAAFKLIPNAYLAGGAAVLLVGLFIWGKVWFHNKVEAEAQKEINAYIATQKKDADELHEIVTKTNTKIQIQYVDRVKVITKVVHDNAATVVKFVPDTHYILSDGWVAAYNNIVQGLPIDPTAASAATPSGVTPVDALAIDNANYGICLQYKATAEGLQAWVNATKAEIASQNKKDK